ncbi:hypothetical protein [Georgenia sp. SUBG003]|uniref:hypothetical protein n=1 Tax=Georgenia sp. SUBG003 TaxID=1497974 RepID=UPI003AB7C86C
MAYPPAAGGSPPRLAVLITAVGVSFILEYGVRQLMGPNPRVYQVRLTGETFNLLGGVRGLTPESPAPDFTPRSGR